MARKTAPESRPAKANTQQKLQGIRSTLDKIDHQILKLINDRAKAVQNLAALQNGEPLVSATADEKAIDKLVEENTGPLDERAVRAVFRELLSGTRSLYRIPRVAYLGPEYSFSHLAAIEKFGQSVDFVPAGSIAGVFEIVNRGQADLGIVPIENSTDGRVADTLDMFTRLNLKICAEVAIRVEHNLLAMCPQADVRRVYSKPQALSQCRNWLANNLPQAQIKEVASTTTAVQLAKQEPCVAAIASRQAAAAYGLNIVAPNIEDRPNNTTRFAVIGHELAKRTGRDKTSIMFQIPDEPGALYEALGIIKKNDVNMTWIESFPGRLEGKKQEYLFFADLEGHLESAEIKRTLAALEKKCQKIVVLGTFPKVPLPG